MPRLLLPAAFLAALLVAACAPAPHVHDPDEFNRESEDFGTEPTTIYRVDICYNTYGTTPAEVRRMAQAECARFNKVAIFVGQDVLHCPMITPARATYSCKPPQ